MGRRLATPTRGLRPTADRVREALFARVGDCTGARVLDLYAGSGALGIEAISRGAARVVFVERDARCIAALRANVTSLGIEEATEIVREDAPRAVTRLASEGRRFELVLLDPPYASREVERVLSALAGSEVLAEGAMVVVEGTRRQRPRAVAGLAVVDERRYGETLITRLRASGASEGSFQG